MRPIRNDDSCQCRFEELKKKVSKMEESRYEASWRAFKNEYGEKESWLIQYVATDGF